MAIRISSPAFKPDGPIPRRHTGQGEDLSPPLRWDGAPADAQQLALIADDPDAPGPDPWVHWVIYNLPPEVTELPEGVKPEPAPAEPTNTAQGRNSWGRIGYGGPQPPAGDGPHHYRFRLYALGVPPTLPSGLTAGELLEAAAGRVQDEGKLIGTYESTG
jgi:hypothetical protein